MYINETGYPSVTQIIKPFINTDWFTEESRLRGNAVHDAAALYLQGLFVPSLDPTHRPYFESIKIWIDSMVLDVKIVEQRLVDKRLGFTGKPDLIAQLKFDPENILTLCDWKTGQAEEKWFKVQNAAYRFLAAKKQNPIITHKGITVRAKVNGSGCLVSEYGRSYNQEMNIFIGLLNAYNFFN